MNDDHCAWLLSLTSVFAPTDLKIVWVQSRRTQHNLSLHLSKTTHELSNQHGALRMPQTIFKGSAKGAWQLRLGLKLHDDAVRPLLCKTQMPNVWPHYGAFQKVAMHVVFDNVSRKAKHSVVFMATSTPILHLKLLEQKITSTIAYLTRQQLWTFCIFKRSANV